MGFFKERVFNLISLKAIIQEVEWAAYGYRYFNQLIQLVHQIHECLLVGV